MEFKKIANGVYENDQYRIAKGRYGRVCLQFTAWKLTRKADGCFNYYDTLKAAKEAAESPESLHLMKPIKR